VLYNRDMERIRILEAALKHGITQRQIREALADRLRRNFEIHQDEHGNPQDMVVGHTESEVLLEIGICYRATTDVIFHANKVTAHYKRLYERGK
jgi:hypothetical protein